MTQRRQIESQTLFSHKHKLGLHQHQWPSLIPRFSLLDHILWEEEKKTKENVLNHLNKETKAGKIKVSAVFDKPWNSLSLPLRKRKRKENLFFHCLGSLLSSLIWPLQTPSGSGAWTHISSKKEKTNTHCLCINSSNMIRQIKKKNSSNMTNPF